ncbi:hypothetical protein FRC12_019903 [Ceratobasidium sp. 428]|nr:hypothetical protein FRC12_019903 [Ceratobasidium sp. 428]
MSSSAKKVLDWVKSLCSSPVEFELSHQPPANGGRLLLATSVIFLIGLPFLILWTIAAQGFELVTSLQPDIHPNGTFFDKYWDKIHLPDLLRPTDDPECEPQELGRGDTFRLSGSLFDYKVMSTWNTSSKVPLADGVQEQKRFEYRAESFADCFVNSTRFDYSLAEQTQTVNVGVICPGTNSDYPIYVSMETEIVFAQELTKDFIGQYYGPGLGLLNMTKSNSSDYHKVALAVLEVISTDSLTIMRAYNGSEQPHSGLTSNKSIHAPEWKVELWPSEANVYVASILNLLNVVSHAVNLDLQGNARNVTAPNLFRNTSLLEEVLYPNERPDNRTAPAQWVGNDSTSFYYGQLPSGYQSWAAALLHGKPVQVGDITGLHNESVMVTTYLCSTYQVRTMSSLVSSVIIGVASVGSSAWGIIWVIVLWLLVRYRTPNLHCLCEDCIERAEYNWREKSVKDLQDPKNGVMGRLLALEKNAGIMPIREEKPAGGQPAEGLPTLPQRELSYMSTSTTGGDHK